MHTRRVPGPDLALKSPNGCGDVECKPQAALSLPKHFGTLNESRRPRSLPIHFGTLNDSRGPLPDDPR
jgi:hypothetical protein